MAALKVSPVCAEALESALCKRTGMGVPSGSFVEDGTRTWLGEMPVELDWRSNGSFCESEALGVLSAGGRLQAQSDASARRMTATQWGERGMSFFDQSKLRPRATLLQNVLPPLICDLA